MAQAKAFCIKGPDGLLYENTVRDTECVCWDDFAERECRHWLNLQADGYACVPILITEIDNE